MPVRQTAKWLSFLAFLNQVSAEEMIHEAVGLKAVKEYNMLEAGGFTKSGGARPTHYVKRCLHRSHFSTQRFYFVGKPIQEAGHRPFVPLGDILAVFFYFDMFLATNVGRSKTKFA